MMNFPATIEKQRQPVLSGIGPKFLAILIPLALAGCSYDRGNGGVNSAGNASAAAYSYDGEYRMIPAPKRLWETPLDIARHFMGNHPEGEEGRPGFEVRLLKPDNADTLILHMTAMGYLDDAVRGEQWRIKINNAGSGWGVSTAENRFMCQRGPNAGQWVIEPCP